MSILGRHTRAPLALFTCVTFVSGIFVPLQARAADEGAEAPVATATTESTRAAQTDVVASKDALDHVATAAEPTKTAPPEPAPFPSATTPSPAAAPTTAPKADSIPVNGNDKTGVSSQAIALPQGAGKIQGMGESFSTELSTGVANFTVPFSLVPARGGAQPSLALHYSSGGGHGIAGVGWEVGLPYIARQTDRGNPQFNDPPAGSGWAATQDRFVFNGGQELVPICVVSGGACSGLPAGESFPGWANGLQYFRARVEGSYLRFFWSSDHRTWRVQSKGGETMELGAPLDGSGDTSGLEADPSNPTHIFRWDLVRQYDAYGGANPADSSAPTPVNVVVYRYLVDGGMSYLSDIYDTTPAASPTTATLSAYAHHTRLSYSSRPDVTFSFRRGWQVTQGLRLTGVDVTSATFGGSGPRELVRRYHLAYDPNFHVSQLTSLQLEGRCTTSPSASGTANATEDTTGALPATNCPTLPAMTFGYQHVAGYDTSGKTKTADLPGYEAFDERIVSIANSPTNSIDEADADLFDINADGLPDVLVTLPGQFGGNEGVFYNGGGAGKLDAFGSAAQMPVTGVPGESAATITLDNQNISAMDIDGDGIIDLLHMPAVKTYSIYSPQGSGTNYSWVGRAVTTASQQSPKIDFGSDTPNIDLMDVNGDGLVDLVLANGTDIETFFSLGRYPAGDGQFGYAQWTGASTASITNSFVSTCVPWAGSPVRFSDSDVKIADMNGDGLPDIVRVDLGNLVYWPGRGNGFWGTGDPTDCPGGSFGQGREIAMASSPEFSDPSGSALLLDDVNGDGLDDLVQVGFQDVEVWLNVDGTSWTAEHVVSNTPAAPSYSNRVRLVDINGTGTRDVVWGTGGAYQYIDLSGGLQPWLLTNVQNGLGKTTTLQYDTSTHQMLAAAAAGQPWTSVAPNPVQVVVQTTESDHLDLAGLTAGNYVTQYTYRDAVYDGRQREFRGFDSATTVKVGDANSPSSTTLSTFLLGQCKNDENQTPDPCTPAGRWEDNPREALKGLPLTSETSDGNGLYLSSAHHTYTLRKLYTGLDGREVRVAFESGGDTFLYDTGSFTPAASLVAMTDVELEAPLGTVTQDTTSSLQLRSTTGSVHLQTAAVVDDFGNPTQSIDIGCHDCSTPDETITKYTMANRPPADQTGWLWRTIESYVVGSISTAVRDHQYFSFDGAGSPTVTQAELVGTLGVNRFHQTTGALVAPTPPQASTDQPKILVSSKVYDPLGVVTQTSAANGRCHSMTLDLTFDELPVMEQVLVGPAAASGTPATPACGTVPLDTEAQYDRGFGLVTQATDLHGEITTVTYDGFGRISTLTKPDPATGNAGIAPSLTFQYRLPADPTATPYSTVVTNNEDGATAGSGLYRTVVLAADGMGRTILTGEQADTSAFDAQPWIIDKVTTYDGKGAVEQEFQPFWSAAQPSPPVTPASASTRKRYDAFGRTIETYGLDGSLTLRNVYHALSSDNWDAADLESGGAHQGTPASEARDGHGRTIDVTERVHTGSAIEQHDTLTTYLPTGQPLAITRVRGSSSVTRWFGYDSLGRMVLNAEPDTATGFVGTPSTTLPATVPPGMHAWQYAYDDNGDLVGTSDARGCGVNFLYDAGGRIVAEDFSPCLAVQQIYSAPVYSAQNVLTGDGTEVFYEYDSLDSNVPSTIGTLPTDTLTIDASLLPGRLVSVSDRASRRVTGYDGRGRTIGIARLLASPEGPSNSLASRYAPTWSVETTVYDGADRPVKTTTGAGAAVDASGTVSADVTGLLANGASQVTTQYSQRGTVQSVGSSYGPLVTRIVRDPDGRITETVYGDVAATTTAFSYDARRRMSTVETYRGAPALWSQQPLAYTPAPVLTGTPTSLQLLLEDGQYQYDVVDNPVEIDDWRTGAEWPAGAKPVSRVIAYDDLYRATSVAYEYTGGSDPWTSPFSIEDTGPPPDPRLALPSPHVSFAHRVESQTYQYDWLGNTTATQDDEQGFYDRSLGAVTNGTAAAGPYQIKGASAAGGRGGSMTAAYDAAGNLASLAVARNGTCLPTGSNCTQRFAYDWDEVGRLVSARRWDLATTGSATSALPTTPANVQLEYEYDAGDQRVIKTAIDSSGNKVYDAYIFPSLELRRTAASGGDYERTTTTEVSYLAAHGVNLARVHYAFETLPATTGQQLHVLLEVPDHLGSTSIAIDAATSELVERSTYMASGQAESDYRPVRWGSFREDYRFTGKEEDVEVGLAYFGKRFLSPYLGRWASADPLAVHGRDGDMNAYAYVHGRLLRAFDPEGLQEFIPPMTPEQSQAFFGLVLEYVVQPVIDAFIGGGAAHAPTNANTKGLSPEKPFSENAVQVAAIVSGPFAVRGLSRAASGAAGSLEKGAVVSTTPKPEPIAPKTVAQNPASATAVAKLSTTQIGRLGENAAIDYLRAQQYTEITQLQNASGHGIDVVARNPNTGLWEFFEVKTSQGARAPALSQDQQQMESFIKSRVNAAAQGKGAWQNADATVKQAAQDIQTDINAGAQSVKGQGTVIQVTNAGTANQTVTAKPWN